MKRYRVSGPVLQSDKAVHSYLVYGNCNVTFVYVPGCDKAIRLSCSIKEFTEPWFSDEYLDELVEVTEI